MRVAHFASLGALAAAAGLATAQPPAPPPSSTNPLVPPVPMNQPMPPPAGVQATPPAGPAMTPPATTPLTTPTPMAPAQPTPPQTMPAQPWHAQAPGPIPPPAAAWATAQPWYPAGPFSDLAHAYNVPMHGPQVWGSVEYLMMWVRPGPVAVPLVNTLAVPEDLGGSVAAGGITDPRARTIFGNQNVEFPTASGVRATLGGWFDCCQENGVETSFFFLPTQSRNQNFSGGFGANGQPTLTVPFNSVGPGNVVGETSATIAGLFNGAAVTGVITEHMSTDLWGANIDGLMNLWKGEFWRYDALGGFKFMDLDENMVFTTSVLTSPFGSTNDQFKTTNHFYGGELGGRVSAQMDHFGLQLAGKVGLGTTSQTVNIQGLSVAPTDFGGRASVGGLFAQSSNIGSQRFGRFSVIPEVNATVSYEINCHLKAYAGYNFLYWTNVSRPGDQIDRNINPNLAAVFGGAPFGVGPAQPARLNRETDFWAQGVSLGMSVSW